MQVIIFLHLNVGVSVFLFLYSQKNPEVITDLFYI